MIDRFIEFPLDMDPQLCDHSIEHLQLSHVSKRTMQPGPGEPTHDLIGVVVWCGRCHMEWAFDSYADRKIPSGSVNR